MGTQGEFIDAVADFADAAASLLTASLNTLTDGEITAVLKSIEASKRRLEAVGHRLTIEVSDRSMPARAGCANTAGFLAETLTLSRAEAKARVNAATHVGVFRDMHGVEREPLLPVAAAAQAEGDISGDQVRGIVKVLNRIPAAAPVGARGEAEGILVAHARSGGSPDDLPKIGEAILARLDPDGTLSDERDRARVRDLTLGKQRVDGMSTLKGEIVPELRALLEPVLAKYARPGMCNPADPESPTAADADGTVDRAVLDAAAARDTRTSGQRNHDALLALLGSSVSLDGLGSHRGLPVATVITMSVEQLEAVAGVATTATGGTVPVAQAVKLAAVKGPQFLAVMDQAGMPLYLGRSRRLASSAQRMALIAAEKGCTRPGCDAPASMTAVHHVTEWSKGGKTDLDNLTLACDRCHALIHDGPGGWKTVVMPKDSRYPGRTGWIAPAHIDPTGTPKVNHRHHAGEMMERALARSHPRPFIPRS
ncbi:HNH endonuclease signature motif containing protein [Nocardia yamanashiensis]|uniref:HNH endonuclease signature motif containing protein n=1 Tax=Nocardia yamanashiensis TaxID=209247 RepID=UPI00082F5B7F|nr:HNH endonuclease signature motif containing protein [Nocardia yamanashiensis]